MKKTKTIKLNFYFTSLKKNHQLALKTTMRTYKIKFSVFNGKWENLANTFTRKRDCKFVIVYEDDDDFTVLRQKLNRNQKWHDDFMEEHARVVIQYPTIANNIRIHPSIISIFRENRLIYDCACECGCDGVGFKFDDSRLVKKV